MCHHIGLRKDINTFIKFYNYQMPRQSPEKLLLDMEYGIAVQKNKRFDSLILLFIFSLNKKTPFKYKVGARQGLDESLLFLVLN